MIADDNARASDLFQLLSISKFPFDAEYAARFEQEPSAGPGKEEICSQVGGACKFRLLSYLILVTSKGHGKQRKMRTLLMIRTME